MMFTSTLILVLSFAAAAQPTPTDSGLVVSTEWLSRHLDDPHVRIIATGERTQYDRAHIRGARFISHEATIGADHRRLPADVLAATLARAGARDDARIPRRATQASPRACTSDPSRTGSASRDIRF